MRPEVEQDLAHTLLIELLAYQFASPVRWIETQDVFLAEKTAERVVEVGPADTLGVMAKRTLASKYEAYDAAKSVQRQILCYNKDAKEIYYDVDPVEDEPEPEAAAAAEAGPASAGAPATAAPAAAAPAPPSSGPAAQVPDEPVQAVDIVRTLIAQKLKKPLLEVPLSKAIKDLVGGEYNTSSIWFSIWMPVKLTFKQVNPRCRMRSSVILAKSSARLPKSLKTLLSTNSVLLCKLPSMATWANSHSR
jgi:fatty acid synthase subunit alpha